MQNFSSYETFIVADYILNSSNYMRIIEMLIDEQLRNGALFDEAVENLANSLSGVISYDVNESILESNSLTKLLINTLLDKINYKEIAYALISDYLSHNINN